MFIRKLTLGVAAAGLTLGSTAVAAAPAARASADVDQAESAVGGFLIPLLAIVAIIGGIIIVSDSDEPVSP